MKRTYEVGLDSNLICLGVSVGTPGVAYTVADIVRSGVDSVEIGESNDDSGNIVPKQIGSAERLRGSNLLIQAVVDFGAFDKAQREQLCQDLQVTCRVSGGLSGDKFFETDLDDRKVSPNKKIEMVTKLIQLI